jgi:hypothetical protein
MGFAFSARQLPALLPEHVGNTRFCGSRSNRSIGHGYGRQRIQAATRRNCAQSLYALPCLFFIHCGNIVAET